MPKRIKLHDYLSQEELEGRYRHATNAAERSHFQILWLLSQQKSVTHVVEVTGYSPGWVRELVRRYNQGGPEALSDRRLKISGAAPLVSAALQAELEQSLQQPPPDGGVWNGRKVADWLSQKLQTKVHRQRGWDYLKRLDYSLQQPRPKHARGDKTAQDEFKKNCLTRLPK